jgi:muramoyltetrapeptide carboxypeptidase
LSLTIRIIRPSGREKDNLLPSRIAELSALGHVVLFEDTSPATTWRYAAASIEDRAGQLNAALVESGTDVVLCARGGYGASDLLPLIDWTRLQSSQEKLIVGFSDISAIHAALYARLGWKGIHGPMPATNLWGKNSREDIDVLLQLLGGYGGLQSHSIEPISAGQTKIEGKLFGGCFSVLTNLLGSPYFPKTLNDTILILEDVAEHPARLMRFWNQWLQTGVLQGVQAVVLGTFLDMGDEIQDSSAEVLQEFAARSRIPTFHCPSIGHISPNLPFQIGVLAKIMDNRKLIWRANEDTPA